MTRLPNRCVSERGDPMLVVSEQGRSLRLRNPGRMTIRHLQIDGCLLTDADAAKCDHGFLSDALAWGLLVELKGSDLRHACRQILATLEHLRHHYPEDMRMGCWWAAIILSKYRVPKLKPSPDHLKLQQKVSGLYIKTTTLEIDVPAAPCHDARESDSRPVSMPGRRPT